MRRQKDERVIKLVWEEVPDGNRPLGRPRLWRDNLKSDLRTSNITGANEFMIDRDIWRHIVKSVNIHPGLYSYRDSFLKLTTIYLKINKNR